MNESSYEEQKKKQNTNWVLSTNETHYELRNYIKNVRVAKKRKKNKREMKKKIKTRE